MLRPPMPTKAERSDATRQALVRVARRLFAKHGFAETSTEAIVQAAGVTRGALYHQFRDKTALFEAVYEDIERDLVARVAAAVDGIDDPMTILRRGAEVFLDACLDAYVSRVVLLEGPAVLGWAKWREIDQAYGLGMVRTALEVAAAAGAVKSVPLDPLAHVLMGGLVEGSLYLANAPDKAAARAEVGAAIGALIEGITAPSGTGKGKAKPKAKVTRRS